MSHYFDKLILLTSTPSEILIRSYSSIFICLIHTKYHLEKLADKVTILFESGSDSYGH